MYWDGHKYTATWSPGVGPVANPVGGGPGSPSAQAAWGPGMPTAPLARKGFFASLFDFGFTSFITLRLLSVIYGLLVGVVLLASGSWLAVAISQGGWRMLLSIVLTPIAALIYLVVARVSMEMIALFFRIGENTNLMVASPTGPGFNKGAADLAYGPAQGPTMTQAVQSPPLADQWVSAAAPVTPAAATPSYCRHSPSERTIFGVDREHGSETCLGCDLPYWPGSPNSLLAPIA